MARQGCSNNIQKNGNKIWYVLHNLVENMSDGKLTDVECDNMRSTIRTIVTSIPCIECKIHSLTWINDTREKWVYELWHHHDTINKKVLLLNPYSKIKGIRIQKTN